MTNEQLALDLPSFLVHCMFCPFTVRRTDPGSAHDDMERHYAAEHGRQIDRIVEGL